jgi:hypothetical protein
MPPYNGYGSLEDSKQNCIALTPKPPRKVCVPCMHRQQHLPSSDEGRASRWLPEVHGQAKAIAVQRQGRHQLQALGVRQSCASLRASAGHAQADGPWF